MDKTALEPRIGLAWKPLGSQNTAVRAGYAIFHDSSWNQGAQGLWENPPFFAESGQFAFTVGGCAAPTAACAGFVGSFDFGLNVSKDFRSSPSSRTRPHSPEPFSRRIWTSNKAESSSSISTSSSQLPGSVVVTVGYAGSRSHHILVDGIEPERVFAHRMRCPSPLGYTSGMRSSQRLPSARSLRSPISTTQGDARYDSLQVKAETKSVRMVSTLLLGYTYARNFDCGFTDGLGSSRAQPTCPLPGTTRADWGLVADPAQSQFHRQRDL